MKKKKETQAAAPQQERVKPTKQQRKHHILMLLFVVLFIAAIWVIRYPQNYVNMFIAHYDGTTSVLESLKGLKRSDVERGELLPYQQTFDDWKETHLRDEVSVTADDGVTLKGGLYDAGSDVTVVLLHTFDGSSTDTVYLFADYYARKGYNILLPDGRDHGESGGDVVTYGRDRGRRSGALGGASAGHLRRGFQGHPSRRYAGRQRGAGRREAAPAGRHPLRYAHLCCGGEPHFQPL